MKKNQIHHVHIAEIGKHYVFVYGTLKAGHGNHHRLQLPGVRFIGEGKTRSKYPLEIYELPYVHQVAGVGHRVSGQIYEVGHKVLYGSLDRLEGHPTFYERELVLIEFNGEYWNCWLYFIRSHEFYECMRYHAAYRPELDRKPIGI